MSPGADRGRAPSPGIAGLILAAGASSRMGRDKALLEYRGKTFLENIVETLRAAGIARILVVLGHHADRVRRRVDLGSLDVVLNAEYALGQTSSLQAGLRALGEPAPAALLLCLVDHPAVSVETIRKLIRQFQASRDPVIVPCFQGRHGHPVLIGRELFPPLLELGSGEGADRVVHQYRPRTKFIEVPDPGILLDVDDAEGYRKILAAPEGPAP